MLNGQSCARRGCAKSATFEKPLCYDHWRQWQAWRLEECTRCHWVYDTWDSFHEGDRSRDDDGYPYHCETCQGLANRERGIPPHPFNRPHSIPPILAHAKLERTTYHVYVLKLNDGGFYVGQTTNLAIRIREHKDGLQSQTKGKNSKLVYFEQFEGERDKVNDRERELISLNQSSNGPRRIREMIERFRGPLRLLDLDA